MSLGTLGPRSTKDALCELYSAISEQQTNNPDDFFIIAGDFNRQDCFQDTDCIHV